MAYDNDDAPELPGTLGAAIDMKRDEIRCYEEAVKVPSTRDVTQWEINEFFADYSALAGRSDPQTCSNGRELPLLFRVLSEQHPPCIRKPTDRTQLSRMVARVRHEVARPR